LAAIHPAQRSSEGIGSVLEVSAGISALAFGFFTATANSQFPVAVRFLVFTAGISSLFVGTESLRELYRRQHLTRIIYRVLFFALITLALGYILSISPKLNEAFAVAFRGLGEALRFGTAPTPSPATLP